MSRHPVAQARAAAATPVFDRFTEASDHLAGLLTDLLIILGTVLFASRFGIAATAWGAVAGAAAHLAIRAIGTTRTSFRLRPGFGKEAPQWPRQ